MMYSFTVVLLIACTHVCLNEEQKIIIYSVGIIQYFIENSQEFKKLNS